MRLNNQGHETEMETGAQEWNRIDNQALARFLEDDGSSGLLRFACRRLR